MGIGYLQEGLAGARDWVDLGAFDAGGLGGRAVIVLVGLAMTVVTQSSSATVAASLAALNSGVIDLPQAAAAVIGADIGTTATAALATIGGNTGSRRTGFAHVIYNMLTGVGAFAILPLYLTVAERVAPGSAESSPEVVAVAFHTTFNTIGVLVALPFTRLFARLIERLFPERGEPLTSMLDRRLLAEPASARDALVASARSIASTALRSTAAEMRGAGPEDNVDEIIRGIEAAREYAVAVGEASEEHDLDTRLLFDCLHLLDHTERLAERAHEAGRAEGAREAAKLAPRCEELAADLEALADDIAEAGPLTMLPVLERWAGEWERDSGGYRQELMKAGASGELGAEELDAALDGVRWVRRLAYHAWRIAFYWEAVGA
jgi:phosphate:Na+ symporter